ncbi:MAG: polyprenyl synthetase family protein [Planctomycetes bacterium]|nr:polyprenyl synthetase family protein [Planctomycetota bacterium]
MSQAIRHGASAQGQLQSIYAPVRTSLDQVEEILRDELSSDDPFVDRLAKHGFRIGGKRLRPALVLLSAQAGGTLRQEHLVLAAVMELIHTATLIHDDVLDEATLRRHEQTVNARWDNEASVLLGDFLFAHAMQMASALDDTFVCRAVSKATKVMCDGELRQVANRGNYDLSEEHYLGIIDGKTAALCACCCQIGAYYAGASEEMGERFYRYGRELGVAFQVADDLLDVIGDEATAGKSLGTDLIKQKLTLPMIRLLGQLSESQREEVQSALASSGNHHRQVLRPWLDRSDAVAYSRDKARHFAQRANAELASLPDSPARKSLGRLTEFVVSRKL